MLCGQARGTYKSHMLVLYPKRLPGRKAFMGFQLRKAALMVLFSIMSMSYVQAQPIAHVAASFKLDVGPLTPITISFRSRFSQSDVHSQAEVRTRGISSIFSEYNAVAESLGLLDAQHINPSQFTITQHKREKSVLQWSTDGTLAMNRPAHKDAIVQAKVLKANAPNTADPITAILRVATSLGSSPCSSTQRVFDGQDVIDLTFTDTNEKTLSGKSIYRGRVRQCEVRWHAVAGRAAERGDRDEVYGISFASLGTIVSGQQFWLPVSMTGSIKGLGFSAYATRIVINEQELVGKTP
jgi:Protein of unknown function (DUF3108)